MKRSSSSSSRSPAPVNRLMVATVVLLAFAGAVGLGTVWLRHQISEVARANKQVQARTAEVERRTAETVAQIATATNPRVLHAQNATRRLGLISPLESQILRVEVSDEMLMASNTASAEQFRRLARGADAATPTLYVSPVLATTLQR